MSWKQFAKHTESTYQKMQQTATAATTVMSQEQSDLVASATVNVSQKNISKNGKSSIILKTTKISINKTNNNNHSVNNNNISSSKMSTTAVLQSTNGMIGKSLAPTAPVPDARAKQVLKEAVDAVVNSFTKHTQGYGRGM